MSIILWDRLPYPLAEDASANLELVVASANQRPEPRSYVNPINFTSQTTTFVLAQFTTRCPRFPCATTVEDLLHFVDEELESSGYLTMSISPIITFKAGACELDVCMSG